MAGGSITSNTNINVTEDVYVGNNIFLGDSSSPGQRTVDFSFGTITGAVSGLIIHSGGGDLVLNSVTKVRVKTDLTVDGDVNASNVFTDYYDGNRVKLESSGAQVWLDPNGNIYFLNNGVVKHTFYSNGTKAGGSIEIDGVNLGMSPVDSPQTRISTFIMDVELFAGVEKEITFESQFAKATTQYAVFPSQPVAIRKEAGKFYAKSEVDCTCDFNVDGYRIGHENTYWQSMEL